MAATKINSLELRKRQLIAQNEMYRQTLEADFIEIKSSLAWIPRTIGHMRAAAPLVMLAAPLAGLLIARRRTRSKPVPAPASAPSKGLFAKALFGINLFHRTKPLLEALLTTNRR